MRIRIDIDVADHELDVATELLTVLRYGISLASHYSRILITTTISSSASEGVSLAAMSSKRVHLHRSCSLIRHDALASVKHNDSSGQPSCLCWPACGIKVC